MLLNGGLLPNMQNNNYNQNIGGLLSNNTYSVLPNTNNYTRPNSAFGGPTGFGFMVNMLREPVRQANLNQNQLGNIYQSQQGKTNWLGVVKNNDEENM
jgi:hypothetical protein